MGILQVVPRFFWPARRRLFSNPLENPVYSDGQCGRDRHAKGVEGLTVEGQFELVDTFDGQVRRSGPA